MARPGGREVVRVGLLGRSGAGACPNLLQRRPAAGSAASRSAEYQRLSSGVLVGFGPLQQIWTTGAAAGPPGRGAASRAEAAAGAPGRRDARFALEGAVPTVILECKMRISTRRRPVAVLADRGDGPARTTKCPHSRRHDHPHPRAAAPGEKGSLFGRWRLLVGRGGVRRNYSYPDRLRYRFLYHSTSPGSLLPGRSWFVRRARVHSTTIFS